MKVDRPNTVEQKAARVNALAEELQEKHVGKYNKTRYKFWAKTIDCGKHKSKEVPPAGSIWNKAMKPKPKAGTDGMDAMATIVADKVISSLNVNSSPTQKDKEQTSGMQQYRRIFTW